MGKEGKEIILKADKNLFSIYDNLLLNHDNLIWKKYSLILLDQFHGLYQLPMVSEKNE